MEIKEVGSGCVYVSALLGRLWELNLGGCLCFITFLRPKPSWSMPHPLGARSGARGRSAPALPPRSHSCRRLARRALGHLLSKGTFLTCLGRDPAVITWRAVKTKTLREVTWLVRSHTAQQVETELGSTWLQSQPRPNHWSTRPCREKKVSTWFQRPKNKQRQITSYSLLK